MLKVFFRQVDSQGVVLGILCLSSC